MEKRYHDRKINAVFFDNAFFSEILKKQKFEDYKIKLENADFKYINRDSKPISYYYNGYVLTKPANPVQKNTFLADTLQNKFFNPALLFVILLLFISLFVFAKNNPYNSNITFAFTAGSLFFFSLLSYQNTFGYLYNNFAFIVGLFALGIFTGALVSGKSKNKNGRGLMTILLLITSVFAAAAFYTIPSLKHGFIIHFIYALIFIITGIASGFDFTSIKIEDKNDPASTAGSSVLAYAFIFAGVSFLFGVSFFPVLGMGFLTALLVIVNIIFLILTVKQK
jgi:MFS family permease